jgi:hypothetical protein
MTITATEGELALDPAEVLLGVANGPGIYAAKAGTKLPTAATQGGSNTDVDFASPWRLIGYLSDDGPTVGTSVTSEDITPWQSITPIRSVRTEFGITLQFVMWQVANADNLGIYFDQDPATPATSGEFRMEIRSDEPTHEYAFAIDARDGDTIFRIGFDRATLTDNGDMQIQRSAPIPLDVTLSALDTNGRIGDIDVGPAPQAGTRAAPVVSGSSSRRGSRSGEGSE